MKKSQIGIAGLAVMGENLVMNMASRGFEVAVYNRTSSKTKAFIEGRAQGHSIKGYYSLEEFVGGLERPRRVMMMLKAGKVVDGFIDQLISLLEEIRDALDPDRHSLISVVSDVRIAAAIVAGGLVEEPEETHRGLVIDRGDEVCVANVMDPGHVFVANALDDSVTVIDMESLEAVERIDFSRPIADAPIHRGFDHFFGTACCPTTDWLYAYIDGDRIPDTRQQVEALVDE